MSKPYSALLLRYPEQKEELALLPHWFYEVLAAFPYKPNRYDMEKADFFHTLLCICYESACKNFTVQECQATARRRIAAVLAEKSRETQLLYNPYINLFLDKCYGSSNEPLGAWLRLAVREDEA